MKHDSMYTNGAIAVKETFLLKDKTGRLPEMSAEEGLRMLRESGFGGAFEGEPYDFERLLSAEEEELDRFVREYAPSSSALTYLLLPRDFHNAKALIKGRVAGTDGTAMLAPPGCIPAERLRAAAEEKKYEDLPQELADAFGEAEKMIAEGTISGAALGALFSRKMSEAMDGKCRGVAKKLWRRRADMTNLLTCFRAGSAERSAPLLLAGGSLPEELLRAVFSADEEAARKKFSDTPYADFAALCFAARERGEAYTAAEKVRESAEMSYFAQRKYALEGEEPFYYYVFRRRAEIADVRVFFVCRLAGMSADEIAKRMRTV